MVQRSGAKLVWLMCLLLKLAAWWGFASVHQKIVKPTPKQKMLEITATQPVESVEYTARQRESVRGIVQ